MSADESTQTDPKTYNLGGHAVPVGMGSAAEELIAELPPLVEVPPARQRSAAEEARTILAANVTGALATLTADGGPWASIVTYGVLADGSPVFSLSTLAAHGRNLQRDQRASLAVSESVPPARAPADTRRGTPPRAPGRRRRGPGRGGGRGAGGGAAGGGARGLRGGGRLGRDLRRLRRLP